MPLAISTDLDIFWCFLPKLPLPFAALTKAFNKRKLPVCICEVRPRRGRSWGHVALSATLLYRRACMRQGVGLHVRSIAEESPHNLAGISGRNGYRSKSPPSSCIMCPRNRGLQRSICEVPQGLRLGTSFAAPSRSTRTVPESWPLHVHATWRHPVAENSSSNSCTSLSSLNRTPENEFAPTSTSTMCGRLKTSHLLGSSTSSAWPLRIRSHSTSTRHPCHRPPSAVTHLGS